MNRRTLSSAIQQLDLPDEKAENRKPRHREVFDTLLGEISSGRLRPGDRLPTEAELAKQFSASRTTIARAMKDLKGQGLLNRQRGGGTHLSRRECKQIALFAPFAANAASMGFIGGQIHGHLSDLATQHCDHMRLQLARRLEGDLIDQMLTAAEILINQCVDGVFYYPVELPREKTYYNKLVTDKLRKAGIPVVAVDRDIVSFPDRSDLPLVAFDNRRAGYLIADHLIKQGCKRIAFVGTPLVSSAAADRVRGFIDAVEDSGFPVDRSMIRHTTASNLNADFCQSLVNDLNPDAIICKHDLYAAMMSRHLSDMGIKVGQDMMLAGFDDEPIARLLPVPLTTIRFSIDPFVQVCYERMSNHISKQDAAVPSLTLIDIELIVRASTGMNKAVVAQ